MPLRQTADAERNVVVEGWRCKLMIAAGVLECTNLCCLSSERIDPPAPIATGGKIECDRRTDVLPEELLQLLGLVRQRNMEEYGVSLAAFDERAGCHFRHNATDNRRVRLHRNEIHLVTETLEYLQLVTQRVATTTG